MNGASTGGDKAKLFGGTDPGGKRGGVRAAEAKFSGRVLIGYCSLTKGCDHLNEVNTVVPGDPWIEDILVWHERTPPQ